MKMTILFRGFGERSVPSHSSTVQFLASPPRPDPAANSVIDFAKVCQSPIPPQFPSQSPRPLRLAEPVERSPIVRLATALLNEALLTVTSFCSPFEADSVVRTFSSESSVELGGFAV